MPGKAVIFSAPSGAGKTTIVKYLLGCNLGLEFSISACSREKRGNEVHGRDYYFLSSADFRTKIENREFLEWEEVYTNHFYGTLKSEIERIWNAGHAVIFDVDVKGGINLKKHFGESALAVFVMPPDIKALENRLRQRKTETEESIKRRVGKAQEELTYANRFDFVLLNDDLENACRTARDKVSEFLAKP